MRVQQGLVAPWGTGSWGPRLTLSQAVHSPRGVWPTGPAWGGQHQVLVTASSTTPGMASNKPGLEASQGRQQGAKGGGQLRVHPGYELPAEKRQGPSGRQGWREGWSLALQPCVWGRDWWAQHGLKRGSWAHRQCSREQVGLDSDNKAW